MDEFIVLLIIAFVIIGAMMAIGTPLANWASGNWTSGGGATGNFRLLSSFDLGSVGLTGGEDSRSVKFGSFTLGETQTESLKSMQSLGVSQGYFGADAKKFEINVDPNVIGNLKDVRISFDLTETNQYGNLVIKWNDKVVFDKVANINRYDIVIPAQDVKETNVLDVSAGNPGLYFWAATFYGTQNFEVNGEYGTEKIATFKVYPNELDSWSKGVLKFYASGGQGADLHVKLNGQEIYSSASAGGQVTREYQLSELSNAIKSGDNVLSFRSSSLLSMENVEFDVFVSGTGSAKERFVNFSKDDITLLRGAGKGKIEFDVRSASKAGILTVKINGNPLSVSDVATGQNSIEFVSSYVIEGRNTFAFSGTGSWDISGVRVGISY
jgi:hypothetical protein